MHKKRLDLATHMCVLNDLAIFSIHPIYAALIEPCSFSACIMAPIIAIRTAVIFYIRIAAMASATSAKLLKQLLL